MVAQNRVHRRSGLILLVVLGMLTLFTLLGVSYVVVTRQSRDASQRMEQITRHEVIPGAYSEAAFRQFVRGSNDRGSAFFGHDILADIYGQPSVIYANRTPMQGSMRAGAVAHATPQNGQQFAFLQLPLNPQNSSGVTILPTDDDALNGRLITILNGPLLGRTFRILHYVGSRNPGDNDYGLRHTVMIDVRELSGKPLVGQFGGRTRELNFERWIVQGGADSMVMNLTTTSPFRFHINEAPYTGVGYGLSMHKHISNYSGTPVLDPQFGNLGQMAWIEPNSSNPNLPADLDNMGPGIPVGLLHSYDAGFDPVTGESRKQFDANTGNVTNARDTAWQYGDTNEGYDVPDHRDRFLAYVPAQPTGPQDIIPSYHRPEVINYIAHAFGDPTTWNVAKLLRFLNVLDYASARPMSYRLRVGGFLQFESTYYDQRTGRMFPSGFLPGVAKSRNIYFGPPDGQLNINLDNWPAAVEVDRLRRYVARLIVGPWDVDNDSDNIADSVFVDPNFPIITGPDGQLVKIMVSPLIEDLDGRVNLNTAGDLVSTDNGYMGMSNNAAFAHVDPTTLNGVNLAPGLGGLGGTPISQGLGLGPTEISLASLLQPSNLRSGFTPQSYLESFFDTRNGLDDLPGARGDDAGSVPKQREVQSLHRHGSMPGMPVSRRGGIGWSLDRLGNPRLFQNSFASLRPISETLEDNYELRPNSASNGDQLFTLAELETVLRRYDTDYEVLPNRLKNLLKVDRGYNNQSAINRLITVRSSELRNMPLPVAATSVDSADPNGLAINAGNALGWIRLLHEERFRHRKPNIIAGETFDAGTHDPPLATADIRNLFPLEFRLGLRFNVNRPFGDGQDNDGDGQVDEPQEIATTPQREGVVIGEYNFGATGNPVHLTSRQLYARQLYCLAQLIVPRDYILPGMHDLVGRDYETNAAFRERRARILAQWAVNVVDFRDADAAMTRFEYDSLPFGLPGPTPKAPGWAPQNGNVVWGMEFPELCLSETLAFHDLRQKDTTFDSTGQLTGAIDTNTDQYRIPQGSLFIELQNIRTTGNVNDSELPAVPSSLYSVVGNQAVLDLERLAPNGTDPVWRIGVSGVHELGASPNDILRAGGSGFGTFTHQFSTATTAPTLGSGLYYDLANTGTPSPLFDRMILFSSTLPTNIPNLTNAATESPYRVFRNTSATRYLPGGAHLVIGPRPMTFLGTQSTSAAMPTHLPSPQRIRIANNSVDVFKLNNTLENAWAGRRQDAFGMICTATPPSPAWDGLNDHLTNVPYRIGLNISEPLSTPTGYYPMPTFRLNENDGDANGFPGFSNLPIDSYRRYSSPVAGQLPTTPFDIPGSINTVLSPATGRQTGTEGTHPNVRTVYLQRLADPEFDYDAVTNPYITIDWMSVDLHVFNGEDAPAGAPSFAFQSRYKDGADAEHLDPNSGVSASPAARRTSAGTQMLSYSTASLVSTPLYPGPGVATKGAALPAYFNYQMGYSSYPSTTVGDTAHVGYRNSSATTLGYLNVGRPLMNDFAKDPKLVSDYDGFGPPLDDPSGSGVGVDGYPQLAVSNLFWPNRIFASPYELMMVPCTAPGTYQQQVTLGKFTGVYSQSFSTRGLSQPFGTYLNFFDSSNMKASNAAGTATSYWMRGVMSGTTDTLPNRADLHLLLETLETPPQFADSTSQFDERLPNMSGVAMLMGYRAPYNYVPSYVNSGKVNINTIADEPVWKAIESNYLQGEHRNGTTGNTNWQQLRDSRRGYNSTASHSFFAGGVNPNPNLNPTIPSQFNGAFRSNFMQNIGIPEQRTGLGDNQASAAGLARKDPTRDTSLMTGDEMGMGKYPDADKQAAIAYQRLMRLPNLVSQQSNVFAIRMTVAYFEFNADTGIGKEISGQGGQMKREQSFFVIDRSIPVGYLPGSDLNTDNIILYRRQVK